MAESKITFDVDIAIKEQTAKFAVDVLNLYLKSNHNKMPEIVHHADRDDKHGYYSIELNDIYEIVNDFEKQNQKRPEVDDDQDQKNEDPDTLPHWKTHYIDNKTMLFSCSKCGFVDTVKRAACHGCGRDMKID